MLLNCLSQRPFPAGALFPLLLRAANGIFVITTVSSAAHLSHPGCTLSTSVTRATIRHLTSWCPVWLLSLVNCWCNHTLQSCYIQIHNGNFCACFWPSRLLTPKAALYFQWSPSCSICLRVSCPFVCRPPSFLFAFLSQWYFSYGVQLTTCIVMQLASLGITSIFI